MFLRQGFISRVGAAFGPPALRPVENRIDSRAELNLRGCPVVETYQGQFWGFVMTSTCEMTAAAFTLRLIDHGLAELAERAERMTLAELEAEHGAVTRSGRSAVGDLVAAVLARELQRKEGRDPE